MLVPAVGTPSKFHCSPCLSVAEDESTLVKQPLGSSNALLVSGVTSGLKNFSTDACTDILSTLFTNNLAYN